MKFADRFAPRILKFEKIYTVRDHPNTGIFELGDFIFDTEVISEFNLCTFKRFLHYGNYSSLEYGFDSHEEMNLYYWEWFNSKKFVEWSTLYCHRIHCIGAK